MYVVNTKYLTPKCSYQYVLLFVFQEPESEEMPGKAGEAKTTPVSMSQRLKELHQQILASQGEEMSYGLQLNGLMSIIDD